LKKNNWDNPFSRSKTCSKEMIHLEKKEDVLTTVAKEPHMDFNKRSILPTEKVVAGDSVDEHSLLEEANILITGDEIRQQNENL
jgi:hypothetical protein